MDTEKTASPDEMLTANEVIVEFFNNKVAYGTLLLMVRRREIPARKCGTKYLFSRIELEHWKKINFGILG